MQYFIAYMPGYSSAWVGQLCNRDCDRHGAGAGSGPDRPVIPVEK